MFMVAQLVYGVLTLAILALGGLVLSSPAVLVVSGVIAGLTYCYHLVAAYDEDPIRAQVFMSALHLAVMVLTIGGYVWLIWRLF